jgi:hypothetical protein
MHEQDPKSVRRLTAALGVLEKRQSELAERLAHAAEGAHLVVDGEGHTKRIWRGAAIDLSAHGVTVVASGAAGERGTWFGAGDGRALDAALARGERFVLWESDPALLRHVLASFDWAQHLATGLLELRLGADLVDLARRRPKGPFVVDVATSHMRTPERRLFENGGARPVALIVEGRLLVDGLAAALDRRGIDAYQLDVENLAKEELDRAVELLRPSFALAINDTNGLAEWTAAHGLPLAVWEIDPSTDTPRTLSHAAPLAHVFTYREAHVANFERAGWSHVEHLPLAADPMARRRRHLIGPQRLKYTSDVAFVGASMARHARVLLARFMTRLGELRGSDTRALAADARALEHVLGEQGRDLDHYRIPALLAEHMSEALALWAASGDPERPEALLGELAASQRRAAVVGALSGHGIDVWGDDGWKDLLAALGDAGTRVRFRGPAGNREEIERVYSGAIVNLDVGRLYQNDIVTLRVFDVLACSGLCLTEHNDAVERLFAVGEELDTWRTQRELVRKVEHYKGDPRRAAAIGARGRRAIEERHALDLRLDHMLAHLVPQRLARAA